MSVRVALVTGGGRGIGREAALLLAAAERRKISAEQVWRERAANFPQNRVLKLREVAQVIAFLYRDAAGGVNGETITVALGALW
jgi:NAD(P)-dependent dehydrogenase (short-subunit alcohol dehydrogenase family)